MLNFTIQWNLIEIDCQYKDGITYIYCPMYKCLEFDDNAI